ncbi:UDP-N-acetylmuramoyl-tripeptide--D-alanyl-D-alanine ligase [Psychromicrobium xiongbiense]|uniref:UDP-N-acetylmuramoyl-tripeptide--D-alanyl-D- alanine ligase n=1 Tax=Psychromicrobium xiongbiense TaxID=3051184 RepID=UPI0025576D3A|nr:UDP-N-acetylmuramoyl-tripeptide--D-alanyl-D-alanine ligase [Psychromicrobium sp. YIM S02556]
MIELTAGRIATLSNGRLSPTLDAATLFDVAAIATDSRQCRAGSLYVAKPGEHSDGHDFIEAALLAGVSGVLAERQTLREDGSAAPAIVVQDAVQAMGLIAAEVVRELRERGTLNVVGITGSAGKTTTKDLLEGILSSQAPTVAPIGSFNGEIGVPLTVFRADETTRNLIVEMGATGRGHIAYLAGIVRPAVGVVLGVGHAHAGEFGGIDNIAQAKGELVEALEPTGIAVLNLADSRVVEMAHRTKAGVLWFGEEGVELPADAAADAPVVRALNVRTDALAQPEFDLQFPDGSSYPVASGLIGLHHVTNLLAAAAAAWALGVPGDAIARALHGQGPKSRWRMERVERADGVTVINDAYNANPESMRAALRTLAELGRTAEPPRRTWAVLGPMFELGEDSIAEHHALGQVVVRLNISRLLVIGAPARAMHIGAVNEGSWGDESVHVATVEEAYELLNEELRPGDIVLFKSSRDAGLRHLGDQIAWGQPEGGGEASER